MLVPTRAWSFDLMRRKAMPLHIFHHSMIVRQVAVIIAYTLRQQGYEMNMPLVDRAAILHDICKIDSIRQGGDHALMGKDLLAENGYPELGDIVGQHVRLKSMELNEALIVNYADKRVMHDTIVSLSKRFVDLMERYGTDESRQERILGHYHDTLRVEDIIVSSSDIDPAWLDNLNLIPRDYPLYCGDRFLREHCPVEQQDEHIDLERIEQNQSVLVDERDLLGG
jgi:uncharacterized protein